MISPQGLLCSVTELFVPLIAVRVALRDFLVACVIVCVPVVLTYGRESKRVEQFEGLFDVAEFGRLMGSTTYALAAAAKSVYPA